MKEQLRPEEISTAIKRYLESFQAHIELKQIGYVIEIGDGIARIQGLDSAMYGELVKFRPKEGGQILNG